MTGRRTFLLNSLFVSSLAWSAEKPLITNFRFGILKEVAQGEFEFVSETTRIPLRLKGSGFRWGIGFDNPKCSPIEWYEEIHLPAPLKEVSGNFQRTRSTIMRTNKHKSDQPSVVDDFWFDAGDPIGHHRMDLFVNGKLAYSVEFDVVPSN